MSAPSRSNSPSHPALPGNERSPRRSTRPLARLLSLCALLALCVGCAKASKVHVAARNGNYLKAQVRLMLVSTMPADQEQARREIDVHLQYIQFERREQRRHTQQYKQHPGRKGQCQTICQAAGGICKSSKRICQISQKYPKEPTFQKACAAATKDCQDSQKTCKSC